MQIYPASYAILLTTGIIIDDITNGEDPAPKQVAWHVNNGFSTLTLEEEELLLFFSFEMHMGPMSRTIPNPPGC